MEFMGRLAALVPRPRVNLTRFHGVFSSNSKLREYAVPAKPADEAEIKDQSGNKAYVRDGWINNGHADGPERC